jgi:hypothetical protein
MISPSTSRQIEAISVILFRNFDIPVVSKSNNKYIVLAKSILLLGRGGDVGVAA